MRNDQFRPRLESDDELTRTLRDLYAAPADEAYWSGLEARILARVASGTPVGVADLGRTSAEWWVFFGDWVRAGVAAAAIVAAAAGVALWQSEQATATAAFESAWEVSPEVPVQTASETPGAREATLRYLISY